MMNWKKNDLLKTKEEYLIIRVCHPYPSKSDKKGRKSEFDIGIVDINFHDLHKNTLKRYHEYKYNLVCEIKKLAQLKPIIHDILKLVASSKSNIRVFYLVVLNEKREDKFKEDIETLKQYIEVANKINIKLKIFYANTNPNKWYPDDYEFKIISKNLTVLVDSDINY